MRIAIIAPEQIPVPPPLGGSVEIVVHAVARQLALRHEVTVISRTSRRYPRRSFVDGVRIERVPAGSPRAYLKHVLRSLSGQSYDVIQIENRPLFVEPIKRQHPQSVVSLFLHSLTYVSPPYSTGKEAGIRQGIMSADIALVNSDSLLGCLAGRYPESAAKFRKVWLGVDTERFRPSERRKPERALTLLFAGRLIPRKGLPVLLRAVRTAQAASPKPLRLIVAGGGLRKRYSAKMKKLARLLRVRARFLGAVPHRAIHQVFRRADVFVCPSQKHEAFGLVNVEALASGLPVIASDIGGIGEIVSHERSGLLVADYRNHRAFAAAILRLAMHPDLLQAMKREARRDCLERFSWSATAERLEQIYEPFLLPEERIVHADADIMK
jgi:spore coat protein SA